LLCWRQFSCSLAAWTSNARRRLFSFCRHTAYR
jgi:hypothetical protein